MLRPVFGAFEKLPLVFLPWLAGGKRADEAEYPPDGAGEDPPPPPPPERMGMGAACGRVGFAGRVGPDPLRLGV